MDGETLKEKTIFSFSLMFLVILGVVSLLMAWYGPSSSWKFLLAFFPLFVILFGVAALRQSALRMSIIGLVIVIILAVFQFGTPIDVALGASAYGFVNSFGISVSVAMTMLMIFVMKEAGALKTVSQVIKQQVEGDEMRALYIGIGFGSFLSSLGVVTPALFPPLLIAMGFSPVASIAIAVLGYNATTSFSLLSIPITLPATIGQFNPIELAFKVSLFLPLVSVGFAFALLWIIGGRQSVRKGAVPALICGLTLAFACLGALSLDYFSGVQYIPLEIVGVVAGLCAIMSLLVYQRVRSPTREKIKSTDYPSISQVFRAFSPWIILAVLATVVNVPQIKNWLGGIFGTQPVPIFANKSVELKIETQIYTWIFVAIIASLATLRPTVKQLKNATGTWLKRFMGPFLTYSLYFCIAYVMSYSAMQIANGSLTQSPSYNQLNMNVILGSTLAAVFGSGYIFVAASLGLFGAIVGGSETSSNVLFLNIQKTAAQDLGYGPSGPGFMTIYASHSVAGGIASAVTPAKINNAVVTIDEPRTTESLIMRKHLVVAITLTVATGILTGIFVGLGI
jgi:lactate permease